jgi:hypothetical protein
MNIGKTGIYITHANQSQWTHGKINVLQKNIEKTYLLSKNIFLSTAKLEKKSDKGFHTANRNSIPPTEIEHDQPNEQDIHKMTVNVRDSISNISKLIKTKTEKIKSIPLPLTRECTINNLLEHLKIEKQFKTESKIDIQQSDSGIKEPSKPYLEGPETDQLDSMGIISETTTDLSMTSLEQTVLKLAQRAEEIGNTSKNLMDVYSLAISVNESVVMTAENFISALKEAVSPPPSIPSTNNDTVLSTRTFQFRNKEYKFNLKDDELAKMNWQSMMKLNANFQNTNKEEARSWKEALVDYISMKQDESRKQIHICAPILNAISKFKLDKDQTQANTIGFLLMSEVCKSGGGNRWIVPEKLKMLLKDKRIEDPTLLKAIRNAAREVQLTAIRKEQSNIVWRTSIPKANKRQWEETANSLEKHEHMNLSGIYSIALLANVPLPDKKDLDDQLLNLLLKDMKKLKL